MFIRPLVEMNVAGVPAPLLLPDIDDAIDLTQFAASVDTLAKRMAVPAAWVREQARMREPEVGEEILTMGAQPIDPNAPEPPDPKNPKDPNAKPEDDTEEELDVPITVDGEED
jgi:phage gp29-like protein